MAKIHTFEKEVYESVAIAPQSITNAEKAGTAVDMAKFDGFAAVVMQKAATQYTGDVTIHIAESTDNSTWSDTYLTTETISSNTATDQIAVTEIHADDLSDGYRYARVEITPAAGTVNNVSAVNLVFNARFEPVE